MYAYGNVGGHKDIEKAEMYVVCTVPGKVGK